MLLYFTICRQLQDPFGVVTCLDCYVFHGQFLYHPQNWIERTMILLLQWVLEIWGTLVQSLGNSRFHVGWASDFFTIDDCVLPSRKPCSQRPSCDLYLEPSIFSESNINFTQRLGEVEINDIHRLSLFQQMSDVVQMRKKLTKARPSAAETMLWVIEHLMLFHEWYQMFTYGFLKYLDQKRCQSNRSVVISGCPALAFVDWDNVGELA